MGRKERRAAERAEKKREVRMTPEKIRDLKEQTALVKETGIELTEV